jgi:hypothetical protein
MTEYTPTCWVILKIKHNAETTFKVLAGWSGGYLDGDTWRCNSGITKVEFNDPCYTFHGYSGSTYVCHKRSETMMMSIAGVYDKMKAQFGEKVELVSVHDIELDTI